MHEYPLTQRIIEIAADKAKQAGAKAVTKITLVVGETSGVVADSIAMYFDLIAEGTPCEHARLVIEPVKPMLRCKSCGKLFERRPMSFACTHEGCSGEGEPTEIGREFYVKDIEVENEA